MPTVTHITDKNLPVLSGDSPTFGGVVISGTISTRASAGTVAPTQVAVFTGDPSLSTRPVVTRTPAQLINDISAVPTARTLTINGTANQIISSAGAQNLSADRTWTLSLPQNINAAASPTFAGLTINGTRPTVNGTGVLLQGEAAGGAAQADLSSTVRTTGDQTISGAKLFSSGNGGYLKSNLIYTNDAANLKLVDNPGNIASLPLNTVYLNSTSPFETSAANANTTGYKIFWNFTVDNPQELSRHIRTQSATFQTGVHSINGPWFTVAQNLQNSTGIVISGFPNRSINSRVLFSNYSLEDRLAHIEKNGVFSLLSGEKMGIGIHNPSEKLHVVGNLRLDGELKSSVRPTVNATGVLLEGEAPSIVANFNNFSANFNISGNQNSKIILANSSSQITGTISINNPTGFNTTIMQVGNGKILITGNNVNILSYYNQYRTAGIGAAVSILHTGNNGYVLYGNTTL